MEVWVAMEVLEWAVVEASCLSELVTGSADPKAVDTTISPKTSAVFAVEPAVLVQLWSLTLVILLQWTPLLAMVWAQVLWQVHLVQDLLLKQLVDLVPVADTEVSISVVPKAPMLFLPD
jgi:hypothetical protein